MAITFNGEVLANGILSPENMVWYAVMICFIVVCLYALVYFVQNG